LRIVEIVFFIKSKVSIYGIIQVSLVFTCISILGGDCILMLLHKTSFKTKDVYRINYCSYRTNDADDDIWETLPEIFDTKEEAQKYINTTIRQRSFLFNPREYYVSKQERYVIPESVKHVITKDNVMYIMTTEQYNSMEKEIKPLVEEFSDKKKLQYLRKNKIEKRKL